MSDLFSLLCSVSVIWTFTEPFDSSEGSKINVIKEEGVDFLDEDNRYYEIHQDYVEAYKSAIRPGILLFVTCAYPEKIAAWAEDLKRGMLVVMKTTERANMVMMDPSKLRILFKFRDAYCALYRDVAQYVGSKDFDAATARAFKVMMKEYRIEEGDYEAVLRNWAIKFEFATIMRSRKFKRIQRLLNETKALIMSEDFLNAFL